MKKALALFLAILFVFSLVACGGGDTTTTAATTTTGGTTTPGGTTSSSTTTSSTPPSGTTSSSTTTTQITPPPVTPPSSSGDGQEITGISFDSVRVDYNGNEQKILVSGTLPQGASVSYTQNKGTDVGNYAATAVITCEGYKTLTLHANLTIQPIAMQGLEFKGGSFEYDTQAHKITITGNVPSGATVTYTGGEDGKNGATNLGTYQINVTVSHKNYISFQATATLKIKTTEELLSVSFLGGKVYFQNALDSNRLYTYSNSAVSCINRDTPTSMITVGGKIYYISKGLLSSGIFSYDATTKKSECLFEVKAKTLLSDGTYLYYNVNNLLGGDNNGIYRIAIADLENDSADFVPTPTRLTTAKADSMVLSNGYIYFENASQDHRLCAVRANATNTTPTLIYDYKVSELVTDGNTIYFTRNTITGDAIYSISVAGGLSSAVNDDSSKVTKVTPANGKYLTLIGDYVYFVNIDLALSVVYGDSICRAKKDGSGWLNCETVVDGSSDNLYSLATDGQNLYYFRANSKHLYQYRISNGTETDLMQNFTPPTTVEPILTYYEKATVYKNEIYYINMKDGGKLYRYSPDSELDLRITNLQVADFAIHEDYVYYCSVRFLVNFDLYRMSLVTGETERLSTDKCMNFSFANNKLYYTSYSGKNTLNCMNLDGTGVTVLFDEESVDGGETLIHDGYVYFVADDLLYRYSLTAKTASIVHEDIKPLEYMIFDGKILFMNTAGFRNSIGLYDMASNTVYNLGSLGVSGISDDLRGMFVYKNEMYFYRNVAAGSSSKGLYKVVKNGNEYEATLIDKFDGYYLCESMVIGDAIYFLDVWQIKDSLPTASSSGKLCKLNLTTKQITKLN